MSQSEELRKILSDIIKPNITNPQAFIILDKTRNEIVESVRDAGSTRLIISYGEFGMGKTKLLYYMFKFLSDEHIKRKRIICYIPIGTIPELRFEKPIIRGIRSRFLAGILNICLEKYKEFSDIVHLKILPDSELSYDLSKIKDISELNILTQNYPLYILIDETDALWTEPQKYGYKSKNELISDISQAFTDLRRAIHNRRGFVVMVFTGPTILFENEILRNTLERYDVKGILRGPYILDRFDKKGWYEAIKKLINISLEKIGITMDYSKIIDKNTISMLADMLFHSEKPLRELLEDKLPIIIESIICASLCPTTQHDYKSSKTIEEIRNCYLRIGKPKKIKQEDLLLILKNLGYISNNFIEIINKFFDKPSSLRYKIERLFVEELFKEQILRRKIKHKSKKGRTYNLYENNKGQKAIVSITVERKKTPRSPSHIEGIDLIYYLYPEENKHIDVIITQLSSKGIEIVKIPYTPYEIAALLDSDNQRYFLENIFVESFRHKLRLKLL